MIVRAVSDSDSDSDDVLDPPVASPNPRRSVFDPPTPVNLPATRSAAQILWLVLCVLLVLLVLLDLAALFQPTTDGFALLPVVLAIVTSDTEALLPPPASLANQFVGLLLVAGWIYSRETSQAVAGRAGWPARSRYGVWLVLSLLCLGHAVSCLYVLFALFESNGDRRKFWLGRKQVKRDTPYRRV